MLPGTQAYWWGINRDWCLAIDFDSDFALFGGSKEFIELLLGDNFIECMRVEIDSKI